MNQRAERLQNWISGLVIVLLVTQTVLLINVFNDLRTFKQLALSGGVNSETEPVASLIGTQAPDFQLNDVNGSPHSLIDYKGETVLLTFTSHTCRYCREMYPGLREFTRDNANIKVVLLALNSSDESRAFQDEFGFAGFENLSLLEATTEVFQKYSIMGTPTFVVVDAQGVIINAGYGITSEEISGLIKN